MALVDCTIIVDASQVVVSTSAAPTILVEPVSTTIVVEGLVGIRGPQGEAGQAAGAVSTQTYEAATNLSGHRAIRVSGGLATLCDGTNAAHTGRCIGITTGAVVAGADATVQTVGLITEPSWNWTEGPVYVGANGVLTQSLAGLAFIQQVGLAVSLDSIDINPQLPIRIS
jgi:hypothetical protein